VDRGLGQSGCFRCGHGSWLKQPQLQSGLSCAHQTSATKMAVLGYVSSYNKSPIIHKYSVLRAYMSVSLGRHNGKTLCLIVVTWYCVGCSPSRLNHLAYRGPVSDSQNLPAGVALLWTVMVILGLTHRAIQNPSLTGTRAVTVWMSRIWVNSAGAAKLRLVVQYRSIFVRGQNSCCLRVDAWGKTVGYFLGEVSGAQFHHSYPRPRHLRPQKYVECQVAAPWSCGPTV
jgi:hypothetical protein